MPGLIVTLRGDITQYEAMMTRSVAIAKASSIAVQKEYEKAQLIISGKNLPALNPLMFGRSGASTVTNANEVKTAAQNYGEWWTDALAKQEAGIKRVRAEELAFLTMVATGGGASASSVGGAHGAGGMTGIIRESLVIIREFSMGRGLGRIGGSVTLLAQYLGVLKLAVRSTATESLLASVAATKLSQSMAAEALAAKGTAAYTDLLAASQAQEAIAAQSATEANIALKGATVTLNPVFFITAGLIVAAGAAAFFLWRHFKNMAESAKNLRDALNPLRKSFTELADAEKKAADAAQEYQDFRKDLLNTHKSESDAIERKIKLLKEEGAARGLSNKQILQQEQQLLMTEQARLKTLEDNAVAAMDAAAKASQTGATGIDFSTGKIINGADAHTKSKRLSEIADAAQTMSNQSDLAKLIDDLKSSAIGPSRGHTRQQDINRYQAELDSTVMNFKVGTEDFSMSLADAKKNFDLASAQAKKLESDQKALDETLKDSKATAKEIADARALVNSDLQDVGDELSHPVKERGSGNQNVTERERIGAAGNMVANKQIEISTQHLEVAKQTYQLIAGRQGDDGVGGAYFV